MPDAEIIKTEINSEPAFVTKILTWYIWDQCREYSRSCNTQVRPYKEKIEELIKKNVDF